MNSTCVGWVANPDGRGTADLLYSCLVTIFLSAWTAYHPDVKRSCTGAFLDKVIITVMVIFAPEYLVWIAMEDWRIAKKILVAHSNLGIEETEQTPEKEAEQIPNKEAEEISNKDEDVEIGRVALTKLSMTHAYCLNMEGFIIRSSDGESIQPLKKGTYEKNVLLFQAGRVPLTSISRAEIEDKSKADGLSRVFACVQISWLFVQLIGRAVQHLSISTLELFTASNAACAVVSYVVWWNKPKDVAQSIVIQSALSYQEILDRKEVISGRSTIEKNPPKFEHIIWVVSFVAILLASISILGWPVSFASYTEQLVWRILSILLPILAIIMFITADHDVFGLIRIPISDGIHNIIMKSLMIIYRIARLYFIVEVFTGL